MKKSSIKRESIKKKGVSKTSKKGAKIDLHHPAVKRVKALFKEMTGYEKNLKKNCAKCEAGKMSSSELDKLRKTEYKAIFSRYCTRGALPQASSYSWASPPAHSKCEVLKIKDEGDAGVLITVRDAHKQGHYLYRLVLRKGEYKVIQKQRVFGGDIYEVQV